MSGDFARVHDPLLRVVGPALVDRLADQVDDPVDALEGCRGRSFERRLPAVPGGLRLRLARLVGAAGEADDLVAAVE